MPGALVLGAGHNGLVAANYLADAGYRVTVLEASPRIGGMAATVALVPDAPEHLLSPCAIDAVYWNASSVAADLQLARHGLRTVHHDPAWAWVGPDGESLLLQKDLRRTVDDVRRFSEADARAYSSLAAASLELLAVQDRYAMGDPLRAGRRTVLDGVRHLRHRESRRLLGRVLAGSAAEVIEDMFVSEPVRGVFASMAGILGSITSDGSAVGLLAPAPLHRHGVVRPVGGMQAIPDALARRLAAAGATVRTGAPVTRIVLEGGRCVGVELADGEQLRADVVISAVPPHVTARLLDGADVFGLPGLRRAPANAAGIGCFTMNFALRGHLALPRHRRADGVDLRRPTVFRGTLEQVLTAEAECRRGGVAADPPWTATILSATDGTQAPAGQDCFYLYGPAPVDPVIGDEAARDEMAKRLLVAAGGVYAGIEELEIGRFTETPRDLQLRLGAENGCIYHVDQAVTRLGPARPAVGWGGHRTPIDGLFLSGAGTHPGGGVSGIPGRLAARAVLTSRPRSRAKEI
jgi:phytoene dehydrogenase-like protein